MKKKNLVWLFGIGIVFIFFVSTVNADVGNSFSGGSSGGFSGGYGGSYSGGYGGGFGSFIFLGGGAGSFGMLFFILLISFLIYSKKTRLKNGNGVSYNGGISNRICNETVALAAIKEVDPDFSSEQFKAYVGEVYITLQEAWESKQWQKVRPFESNALFNTHNRQIQEYIDMGRTNHLNMQNIRSVTLADFKVNGTQEVLSVKLVSSLLDYVTDDATGEIIEGSNSQYQYRTYYLEFIRTAGVKSKQESELKTTNCPNCGAPTNITSSGECEYCHSIITTGDFGWVLNQYSAW